MPVRCQCRSVHRSPQKPRLLQSHDVPGLRLLCVERSPLSTRLVSHKIQSQRKFCFRSGIIYHSSSQNFHFYLSFSSKERRHWNSLVPFWSSPSFRRGTSSNRAITTSRGLPAYLGTKYPGTFLNSQHQENHVHLPAVLLPVCHQATTHRTLLLGPASNNFACRSCLGADSSLPLSQADIRLITYRYSPLPSLTARHAPVVLYTS